MKGPSSRFYSSLLLLLVLNGVIKPVWIFVIDRQVQNEVGFAAYGDYFAVLSLSVVFSFLLDLGLGTYLNRQLAYSGGSATENAGGILLLKLGLALLYMLLVLGTALATGVERMDLVLAVVLVQVFTSFFLFFRSIITALQYFRADAWLSVFDKTVMILLCGALLFFPAVFGKITVKNFLWLQVASTFAATLLAAGLAWKKGFRFDGLSPRLQKLLARAWPYALIVLLMSVHNRFDGFLLERMQDNQEAGVYASAYRLLDAANMVGYLFASFLLPFTARMLGKKMDISPVMLRIRHILLGFSIGVVMISSFLASWPYTLLYPGADPTGIIVLQWCLPALIGYALIQVYGTVMTAAGNMRAFCLITLAAVALNVMLNISLVPSMGAQGSCIAAICSQSACGLAAAIYVHRKMGLRAGAGSIGVYLLLALMLGSWFYAGNLAGISPPCLIAAAVVLAGILLFITKLFRPSDFIRLLSGPAS